MQRILFALAAFAASLFLLAPEAHGNGILMTGSGARAPTDARQTQVRLQSHRVAVKITDQVAHVTVEQVFRSRARRQLEGTYVFPLPEGAVVSDFAMTMAGKMVKGEVIEARRARRIYEGIVRRRRDPGLLEYLGRGLFRARVFPIEPGKDLTIRLSFQQVLHDDAGTLEFRYPLATDRMNGAPVQDVLVKVDIESRVDLKAVYSPSHKLEVKREGERKAQASFESHAKPQKHDFLLYVGRSPEAVGFSLLSHKEPAKDGTFMAVLAPQNEVAADERAGRDVVFVLDTSGSMQGAKIQQARRALAYGVRTLTEKDRFNVVGFASGVRSWRGSLVPWSEAARDAALLWILGLEAAGGTNIEQALRDALGMAQPDRRCMVVFLTDGKPTVGIREPALLVSRVMEANRRRARVFTFGVGYDLDVKLLDKIAASSRGVRDYVAPHEDIEVVTGRFFRKVAQPVLTDVTLDLGDGVYDVYPKHIDDLFSGTQVVVFGRYRKGGDRSVVLKGMLDGQAKAYGYTTKLRTDEPGAPAGADYLERLWANRKVAYLLDAIRLNGETKEVRDEVIQLATAHSIVTPYTSGLVVEESELQGLRVETDNDLPYEESFGQPGGLSDKPFEGPADSGTISLGGGAGGAFKGRGGGRDLGTGGGGRKKFDVAVDDALRWLAAHQSPDGSWSPTAFDTWCDGKPQPGYAKDTDRGRVGSEVSVTALTLSAFLSAGYTNRGKHPFAKVVSRAARYLKNRQDPEGCFGPRTGREYVVAHAQAALAMVEVYGMTGSPIFKGSARRALDFIALARNPYGAWGYGLKLGTNDLRVSAWMTSVLHSAEQINRDALRRGRAAPFDLDAAAFEGVRRWLGTVTDPKTGIPRAVALGARTAADPGTGDDAPTAVTCAALGSWLRILLGADARKDAVIGRAAPRLAIGVTAFRALDPEAAYFGTLAAFQVGRKPWAAWKEALEDSMDSQDLEGGGARYSCYCRNRGSFAPFGESGEALGRVGVTAHNALNLMVMYRYERFGRASPRRATRSAGPGPLTEAQRAAESQDLRRRKEASSLARRRTDSRRSTRTLAGKTFVFGSDGRWVDSAWDRKAEPVVVEAWSDAYFALVKQHPKVARYLYLGERLLFVLGAQVYEVVPAR